MKDALERLAKVQEDIKTGKMKFKLDIKPPMGWCCICGAEREMDLWYHGAGRAGFGYFPCDHSSHHEKGDKDVWKDEYSNVVPEDKLIHKGA